MLVLFVVSVGVIYALPNIYPPDFAVQISTESADGKFTTGALTAATSRLEEESIKDKKIIHNYGHGGAGVTLSWGCADEVVKLIKINMLT